jgi:hypothetical protein
MSRRNFAGTKKNVERARRLIRSNGFKLKRKFARLARWRLCYGVKDEMIWVHTERDFFSERKFSRLNQLTGKEPIKLALSNNI